MNVRLKTNFSTETHFQFHFQSHHDPTLIPSRHARRRDPLQIHAFHPSLPLRTLPHKVSEILPGDLALALHLDFVLSLLAELPHRSLEAVAELRSRVAEDAGDLVGYAVGVGVGVIDGGEGGGEAAGEDRGQGRGDTGEEVRGRKDCCRRGAIVSSYTWGEKESARGRTHTGSDNTRDDHFPDIAHAHDLCGTKNPIKPAYSAD